MAHASVDGRISYDWSTGTISDRVAVTKGASLGVPAEDSHEGFIIEHYWGYTARAGGRVDEYKVEHPKWELFSVADTEIKVDFGKTYGSEFAFLSDQKPYSTLLAKGSEIAVYKGKKLLTVNY